MKLDLRPKRRAAGTPIPGASAIRALLLVCGVCGCNPDTHSAVSSSAGPRSEAAIRQFCGGCHAFPEPHSYPRHAWPEKVREGFHFYYASLRTDLELPPADAVEEFYLERSPAKLNIIPSSRRMAAPDGLFSSAETVHPLEPLRAIAHLRTDPGDGRQNQLLCCDMRTGRVWQWLPGWGESEPSLLAECLNPCHVEPVDLDGDGARDYVVGDLGSFLPEDHNLGAVWFIRRDARGTWAKTPLLQGIGRVADVQPIDADSDGDLDLLVTEFGWRDTGRILLLRNAPDGNGAPRMTMEVVDERHGTINVPVADLNGDGHADFVALISQEHEVVEAFLNRGDGTFERQPIYDARNPGFGSSHIQLADIDGDGDLDVLHVNGDSLDTPIAKPYHGVRWLENTGTYPYAVREICQLPGGHCARAGDLDGDGDLDIAAVALLPGEAIAAHPSGTFDSILWLEQTGEGAFVGHVLERDTCVHAACELCDWDEDGDLDLVVGDMTNDGLAKTPLRIFRNRTR